MPKIIMFFLVVCAVAAIVLRDNPQWHLTPLMMGAGAIAGWAFAKLTH